MFTSRNMTKMVITPFD